MIKICENGYNESSPDPDCLVIIERDDESKESSSKYSRLEKLIRFYIYIVIYSCMSDEFIFSILFFFFSRFLVRVPSTIDFSSFIFK